MSINPPGMTRSSVKWKPRVVSFAMDREGRSAVSKIFWRERDWRVGWKERCMGSLGIFRGVIRDDLSAVLTLCGSRGIIV